MDLVERGLPRAANIVLNGYFAASRRSEDCDGIAALPFFMSLRAAIRAKVTAARRDLSSAADRDDLAQSAKRYFDLARELLAPPKPVIICTGGLSGTGKSLLARALAPHIAPAPGALIFRSDVERKALYGVAEYDRLPAEAYRPEISDKIYHSLTDKAVRVARAGYSVIVDAVFARPEERAAIEAAAAAAHAEFRGLFLVADLPTRLNRVGIARARRVGCRRQGRTYAGRVRYRHGHMDDRRCLGLAGANARQCPRGHGDKIGRATAPTPRRPAACPTVNPTAPRWRGRADKARSASRCRPAARWRKILRRLCG